MKVRNLYIARLALILALTLVIQGGGFPQPITGPLINAMLLITAILLAPIAGVILGILTPLVAVLRGQLPAILAPMVPFIMIGNGIYVLLFCFLKSKHNNSNIFVFSLFSLIIASLSKFIWIFFSAKILLVLFFNIKFPEKLLAMMSFPQFVTAMTGGLLALLLIKIFSHKIRIANKEGVTIT